MLLVSSTYIIGEIPLVSEKDTQGRKAPVHARTTLQRKEIEIFILQYVQLRKEKKQSHTHIPMQICFVDNLACCSHDDSVQDGHKRIMR